MTGIIFFSVFVFNIVSSQSLTALPECPSQESTDPPIYLSDDDDCGAFYECVNGQATHLVCPSGTYYDESLNVCNFAENVECGTRPTTPEPSSTTPEITTPFPESTPPPWQSTETSTASPIPETTFPPSEPTETTSTSLTPETSTTSARPETTFPPSEPTETTSTSPTPETSTTSPIPETTFPPWEPTETTSTSPTPETSTSSACPGHEDGTPTYLEDPTDCSAFYECINGKAHKFYCAVGTYYDITVNRCKLAGSVDCGTRSTTPSPTTAGSTEISS